MTRRKWYVHDFLAESQKLFERVPISILAGLTPPAVGLSNISKYPGHLPDIACYDGYPRNQGLVGVDGACVNKILHMAQTKKSRQERSGEFADQFTAPPRPIHRPRCAESNALHTSALKCADAPSCWNHIRAFTLSGTLYSRTLHPCMQLNPCVLHFACKSGILRGEIAHVCYE
ncbi:uncharacterized protein TNCV_5044901 [Trichonephila clavipes]|uniref:Uncharacterized protein n=1 Tax=Trichonephila clavipes TaxID=2585209 RepID=A0A8X7BL08_TRICX|nr:uncharacterized protein TNCV_5044901 [Trichonephila clavipes]